MSVDKPDTVPGLFQVLGLQPGASLQDIRRAYKQLVLKLHPDKNQSPSAVGQFQELHHAYEDLCSYVFQSTKPQVEEVTSVPPKPQIRLISFKMSPVEPVADVEVDCEVIITFKPSSQYAHYPKETQFTVDMKQDGDCYVTLHQGSNSQIRILGLQQTSHYQFRITPTNVLGNGPVLDFGINTPTFTTQVSYDDKPRPPPHYRNISLESFVFRNEPWMPPQSQAEEMARRFGPNWHGEKPSQEAPPPQPHEQVDDPQPKRKAHSPTTTPKSSL